LQQTRTIDNIHLEVKKAFLRTQEAEKAIQTVEKAIEQAKENYRINQERYKEQVGTATDVLIAQTLLSRTMTNYYSALYEFKIAKASLFRAMGQEVIE
jgi:outer membrane protein TolC